jgi:hypothetical protein
MATVPPDGMFPMGEAQAEVAPGAFHLNPQSAKLKKMFTTAGPGAPGAPALIRKLFLVSRIELVLLVLIVADMVLKPGL